MFLSEGVWQTNVFPVNQHRILDFITFALNFPDKTNWKFCLWDHTWLLCMDDGLGYELTLQMLYKQLQSLGMFYQFWGSCLEWKNVCLSAHLPYKNSYIHILHSSLAGTAPQLRSMWELKFFNQGSNPDLLHWNLWVLTTGPPGKSPYYTIIVISYLSSWLIKKLG